MLTHNNPDIYWLYNVFHFKLGEVAEDINKKMKMWNLMVNIIHHSPLLLYPEGTFYIFRMYVFRKYFSEKLTIFIF